MWPYTFIRRVQILLLGCFGKIGLVGICLAEISDILARLSYSIDLHGGDGFQGTSLLDMKGHVITRDYVLLTCI